MHLFSAHLIPTHWGQSDEQHLRRIQPRSIKIIDRFSRVPQLYQLSPKSLFVYRDHPLSEQHDDMWRDPRGTGRRHADDWADKLRGWKHPVPSEQQIVLGINEPRVWDDPVVEHQGTPEALGVTMTVEYTVAFLDRLTEHGIRGGALNLSVGWPANDGMDRPPRWDVFDPVRESIQVGQHILFLHEYWDHNGPDKHWGWWAGRALKCPWDVPIVIGECGMEERVAQAGLPPHKWGWRGWLTQEQYMSQLWEYHNRMIADKRIHSLQIFTWDFSQPFESTDIRPILHLIPPNDVWDNALNPMPKPPEPGPEPPGFADELWTEATSRQVLYMNPDAALQKAIASDGYAPVTNEFPFRYDGISYIAQRAENLSSGDIRVYYVRVGDWGNVQFIDSP